MQKIQGFTEQGNTQLTITGAAGTIQRRVQGSYPGCTVNVYLNNPQPVAIAAISRFLNIVTVTVPANSGFIVGQQVTIAGVTDASFNGTFNIASAIGTTQFTYAQTGAGASSSGGTANSTLRRALIYADNSGTPKANPFTAGADGTWFFYGNGVFDVQFSGAGIAVPFTVGGLGTTISDTLGPAYINPTSYPGGDLGAQITAAVAAGPLGAIIDCRGITGPQQAAATIQISKTCTVLLPQSMQLMANPGILISGTAANLIGQGQHYTFLQYTGNGVAVKAQNPSPSFTIPQCKIMGFTIDGSGNATVGKIGLLLIDTEEFEVSDIAMSNWTDASFGSIGAKLQGRQSYWFNRITFNVDRPFLFDDDVIDVAGDLDHSHFSNIYTIANNNPHFEVTGTRKQLSNITFDGYQAWARGSAGFKMRSTTDTGVSINLLFQNIRWEQDQGSGSDFFIELNNVNGFYNVVIINCYGSSGFFGGAGSGGFSLGGVATGFMAGNVWTTAAPSVALHITEHCRMSFIANLFGLDSGNTVTFSGPGTLEGSVFLNNNNSNGLQFGTANRPSHKVVLPNQEALAGENVAGNAEIPMVEIDANNRVRLAPDGLTPVVVTGENLWCGRFVFSGNTNGPGFAQNASVLIPFGGGYGIVNHLGTGEVALVTVDTTDDSIFINPSGASPIRIGAPIIGGGGGATATLALGVGAANGPVNATQYAFMKFLDGSGTPFWVPIWH